MALEIKQMGYADIEKRIAEMPKDPKSLSLEQLEQNTKELIALEERRAEIKKSVEERQKTLERVLNATADDLEVRTIASVKNGKIATEKELRKMNNGTYKEYNDNEDLEIRSLQKYLNKIDLNAEERSALVTSGASAVIPKEILGELITDRKYSDLLSRATIIQGSHIGETSIPIAEATSATWKEEGTALEATNGALSAIKLNGFELMRLMSISTATDSLSTVQFKDLLLNLLSEEVIETLEQSFVQGSGISQPKGLDKLDFTDTTVTATESIKLVDVAEALGKLENRYSRNAIIMANSKTMYGLSLTVSEGDNTIANGATTFLGKEILVNQHIEDDVVYVLDPKQLYVKMAYPIQIEADRSSGFRSATINLRALAVIDFAFNEKAVAKVVVA